MKNQKKNLMDFKIKNDSITVKKSFQNKFESFQSQQVYSNIYGSRTKQIK